MNAKTCLIHEVF